MLLAGFGPDGRAAWWQVLRADRLAERTGNPRVAELSARNARGTVYAADGSVLARSEAGPDGRNQRIYPIPSLAHTLGYVSIRYGVSGLEDALNGYLSGDRGSTRQT